MDVFSTVSIPMGANCSSSLQLAPLFVGGRLHTGLLKKHEKKIA
jgi:hypothetical protein